MDRVLARARWPGEGTKAGEDEEAALEVRSEVRREKLWA